MNGVQPYVFYRHLEIEAEQPLIRHDVIGAFSMKAANQPLLVTFSYAHNYY